MEKTAPEDSTEQRPVTKGEKLAIVHAIDKIFKVNLCSAFVEYKPLDAQDILVESGDLEEYEIDVRRQFAILAEIAKDDCGIEVVILENYLDAEHEHVYDSMHRGISLTKDSDERDQEAFTIRMNLGSVYFRTTIAGIKKAKGLYSDIIEAKNVTVDTEDIIVVDMNTNTDTDARLDAEEAEVIEQVVEAEVMYDAMLVFDDDYVHYRVIYEPNGGTYYYHLQDGKPQQKIIKYLLEKCEVGERVTQRRLNKDLYPDEFSKNVWHIPKERSLKSHVFARNEVLKLFFKMEASAMTRLGEKASGISEAKAVKLGENADSYEKAE